MSGIQYVLLVLAVGLGLVVVWSALQSRRIDRHEKRIQALEKKP